MKKKITLCIVLGVILTGYSLAWGTRYKTGLAKPAANARYFYYGKEPGHWADKMCYAIFYPVYGTRYWIQSLKDEGHWDVHVSDRKDPALPVSCALY